MSNRTIGYKELTEYTSKVLESLGYPKDKADLTAWVLVEADVRGVASHGVARLSFYEANMKGGFAFPENEPKVVHETPMSVVVDGNNGVGSHVADFAMDKIMDKAEKVGAGFAAIRNSNHYGMAGLWAEKAAARNQIGMSFTNTRVCSVATYGMETILGTNPVCFAIPQDQEIPFMLDMATTTVAHGKIEVYERRGLDMPHGWAVDETGNSTTDTKHFQDLFRSPVDLGGHLFLGGEGEENGGHKGYGMGLLVDLLCAGLSMGRWSNLTFREKGSGSGIAHFLGAMRMDLFGDAEELKKHVGGILEQVRTSGKAEGQERIFIHGEKEAEAKAKYMKEGVPLDGATVELLDKYGERFGMGSLFK